MNLKLRITLVTLFFGYTLLAQVVYVKHDATGANNGSSWADAYTDVQDALDNALSGSELWIAAGTYNPGGSTPSPSVYYSLPNNLELYGGFGGTETMRSQRDWTVNLTILSGDLAGDDLPDDYITNRSDNVKHIMWLDANINNNTIIDGIYFRNGQTDGVSGSGNNRRGAAILTFGAPIIQNCQFEQNFGWFGAVYPRYSGSTGTKILDCKFIKNSGGSGGGIFTLQNNDLEIKRCQFTENQANYGGGLYQSSSITTIENCLFIDNSVINSGGGMYSYNSFYVLSGSAFVRNLAPNSSGGGLLNALNDSSVANIINSTFVNNEAGWGAGLTNSGKNLTVTIDSCLFQNNIATVNGGGLSNSDEVACTLTNSEFVENTAKLGAGIFCEDDSTDLTVDNVLFERNETAMSNSPTYGGGIHIHSGSQLLVNNSTFRENHSNFGGAISMSEDTSADRSFLKINNSYFYTNIADNQGAALDVTNADLEVTNCVFGGNANTSTTGNGGAISINAINGDNQTSSILNSSFGNNVAAIGAGISHYTDNNSASLLTLKNSIFEPGQFGVNYAVRGGTPIATSQGGNLSSDNSFASALSHPYDLNHINPDFVDKINNDLHLSATSPCIDKGIDAGAPLTDIENNMRFGMVDMGAYEFQGFINNEAVDGLALAVTLFPNPIADLLNIRLENNWKGNTQFTVIGMNGAIIKETTVNKSQETVELSINLKDLPNGVYELRVSHEGRQYAKPFMKGQQ